MFQCIKLSSEREFLPHSILLSHPYKSVPKTQLVKVLDYTWDDLAPDSDEIIHNVGRLPVIEKSILPYNNQQGKLIQMIWLSETHP
jgi:hypothetical protein